jgi:hypothetical protein
MSVEGKIWSSLTTTDSVPRRNSHTEVAGHRNNLTLHIAEDNVPASLVDAELRLASSTSIGVGCGDDVRGCIADSQVQDLALLHNSIKGVHDLLNAGSPVPPVDVQDVDPVGLELLQRVAQRDVEGASVVAGSVEGSETLAFLVADVVGGELGGDDHLISTGKRDKSAKNTQTNNAESHEPVTTLFHPLADPQLRLVVLVVVGTFSMSA